MPQRRHHDVIVNAERLAALLKERGKSQNWLAIYAGVSRSFLNLVLKGKRQRIGTDVLYNIALALKVQPEELLTVTDPALLEQIRADTAQIEVEQQQEEEIGRQVITLLQEYPEELTALAELPEDIRSSLLLHLLQTAVKLRQHIRPESSDPPDPPDPPVIEPADIYQE